MSLLVVRLFNQLTQYLYVTWLVLSCLSKSDYQILNSFSCVHLTYAWNTKGHEAIGMVAMSVLTPNSSTQIKRLMSGKDVVDVSDWGNRVAEKYPHTAQFLDQLQSLKGDCSEVKITNENCPGNRCLVRVVQYLYGRLTGQPDLAYIEVPKDFQITDSDALRLLISLIGELHQPLSVGFMDDRGGRNITVTFIGADDTEKTSTMHDYWEAELIDKVATRRPSFWYGGWTHSNSLGVELHGLQKEWDAHEPKSRHLLFEKWATESLHIACSKGYKDVNSGEAVNSGFKITPSFEYSTFETVKKQILTAGSRTGFVLNSILSGKGVVKLRQGSSLDISATEDTSSGRYLSTSLYLRSFCINCVIILIVLGLFVYIIKFYGSSANQTSSISTRSNSVVGKQMEKHF